MSLDISLIVPGSATGHVRDAIFVRENGQTIELSREEWDRRYPHSEPVTVQVTEDDEVFSVNITHNLGLMADELGVYELVWRPEELPDVKCAGDIIDRLDQAVRELKGHPDYYKQFNPENGWGSYETLLSVLEDYLAACRKYPNAKIETCR